MAWTQEYQLFVFRDRPGESSLQKDCWWLPDVSTIWAVVIKMANTNISHHQVFLKTTLTRTITQDSLLGVSRCNITQTNVSLRFIALIALNIDVVKLLFYFYEFV